MIAHRENAMANEMVAALWRCRSWQRCNGHRHNFLLGHIHQHSKVSRCGHVLHATYQRLIMSHLNVNLLKKIVQIKSMSKFPTDYSTMVYVQDSSQIVVVLYHTLAGCPMEPLTREPYEKQHNQNMWPYCSTTLE